MSEKIYEEGHEFPDGEIYKCDFDTLATGVISPTMPDSNVRRTRELGGPSDDLNVGLTPDRVNSGGFGVRVRYRGDPVSGAVTFKGVRIRVWYLPPVGEDAPSSTSNILRGNHPAWTAAKVLGNGTMVVAGTKGRVRYSTDRGQTWTDATIPGAGARAVNALAKVGSGLIAVGDMGLVAASADGITWSRITIDQSIDLKDVTVSRKNREYLLMAPTRELFRNKDFSLSSPFDIANIEFLPIQASLGKAET